MTMSTVAPLTGEEEASKQGAQGLAGHHPAIIASASLGCASEPQRQAQRAGMLGHMHVRSATQRIIGCQGSPGSRGVVGLAL